ncbi:Deaminase [Oopsacas minuta]|uniref:Deaminase n=1 Tax=Oopsacas minuta TaxID=111878 RepID=A0AAV7KUC0_9METZ|nr:Deaminase [Oopsacas minuta]
MSSLTTGCRFVCKYPNSLNLKLNLSISKLWRDLFAGFCVDFETIQHSNEIIEELQGSGAQISCIVIRAEQLVKLSTNDFPILPTNRILLQDLSTVSQAELEDIFNELPSHYKLTLSVKQNELEVVSNILHLLFGRGICFCLSRESIDTEPLSDIMRTLSINLNEASQLIHNAYKIGSLSVYEESRFLDILRLTDMRYAVRTPPKRVAIFGGRDTKPDVHAYKIAHEIALSIASKGFKVITGAYVGIMEAANSGAIIGEKKCSGEYMSEGILSPTLFFRNIKGNKSMSKRYVTHGLNQRTDKLVEDSSILIAMPGGVGTLAELLVGLGMTTVDALYSVPGFPRAIIACRDPWQVVLETSWELMKGSSDRRQLKYVEYFDTVEEAVQLVEKNYELLVKYSRTDEIL